MPFYEVYFEAIASTLVEVEAADADEAEDLAAQELPTICAQCAGMTGLHPGIDLGDWEVDDVLETEVADE